jgi:hypothetical protein
MQFCDLLTVLEVCGEETVVIVCVLIKENHSKNLQFDKQLLGSIKVILTRVYTMGPNHYKLKLFFIAHDDRGLIPVAL